MTAGSERESVLRGVVGLSPVWRLKIRKRGGQTTHQNTSKRIKTQQNTTKHRHDHQGRGRKTVGRGTADTFAFQEIQQSNWWDTPLSASRSTFPDRDKEADLCVCFELQCIPSSLKIASRTPLKRVRLRSGRVRLRVSVARDPTAQ